MKKIQEKKFWCVYHNTNLNILEYHWKNVGYDMLDEEFKSYILESVKLLKKYKVKAVLIDAHKYHQIMSLEIQEWHDTIIVPQLLKLGLKTMVFVLNLDTIEAISLEQSFNETKAKLISSYFVESSEQGRNIINKLDRNIS